MTVVVTGIDAVTEEDCATQEFQALDWATATLDDATSVARVERRRMFSAELLAEVECISRSECRVL